MIVATSSFKNNPAISVALWKAPPGLDRTSNT
eukprot:CAMPEP_0194372770 /NCGR_PEP_ID=MMETSP0174-20130528/21161_1 /TAXON_ID=216777 /ORGANISM="Proboscia alata, Strain PI-D3" /LENGTH=31 /DNA_ID= /DNA_START= /DNA_END= /DNA_ORIENTATION=